MGVSVPEQRRIVRVLARESSADPPARILAVAYALIDTGVHEARQIAFELLGGRGDLVASLDASVVEALGHGNDNWASVDCFGVYVAGPAWRDGLVGDADVLRWARSPDPWWRRTALVSTVASNQRSRGGRGDTPRTLRVRRQLAADRHPLVVKALSWALRSLAAGDAPAVRGFLADLGEELPARVRREVRKKLETGRKSG